MFISLDDLKLNNRFMRTIEYELFKFSTPIFTSQGLSGGSGTFASFGGMKGILTASHISLSNGIFIPCFPRRKDPTVLDLERFDIVKIHSLDKPGLIEQLSWSDDCLDIAFLELNSNAAEQLSLGREIEWLDLSNDFKNYQKDLSKYWHENSIHNWLWVCTGFPMEGATLEGSVIKTPFAGVYLGGVEAPKYSKVILNKGEFDADIVHIPLGPTSSIIPRDFRGISGGGLWMVAISTSFEIVECFFAGIVVAQKGHENDQGVLICRGPESLYEVFLKQLNVRASSLI